MQYDVAHRAEADCEYSGAVSWLPLRLSVPVLELKTIFFKWLYRFTGRMPDAAQFQSVTAPGDFCGARVLSVREMQSFNAAVELCPALLGPVNTNADIMRP